MLFRLTCSISFALIVLLAICSCNSEDNDTNVTPTSVHINSLNTEPKSSLDRLSKKEKLTNSKTNLLIDNLLKKEKLTKAEKHFFGEVFVMEVRRSKEFRKKFVESQFKKWENVEKKKGSKWLEGVITNTFNREAWTEYQNKKESIHIKINQAKP